MTILTTAEMKAAEAAAVKRGTSYLQLMENAGLASAEALKCLAKEQGLPPQAVFLCGKGNNGGDAFVAARHLAAAGWACCCLPLCGKAFSPLAAHNLKQLPPQVLFIPANKANFSSGFIVDAVFGTGFRGSLPLPIQQIFNAANRGGGLRVALDIPSGIDSDTGQRSPACFAAAYTLAFGALKPGLLVEGNQPFTGQLLCLDIGL